MPAPDDVAQLKSADPATVVATLAPLVKQYAGLPADWVVDAMAQLADAYDAQGKSAQASDIYAQINALYPGSPYQNEAIAGAAKLDLNAGKTADALSLLQPVVNQANQHVAPSAAEARGDAKIFLVYGQVLQAQKQNAAALEAYLTVKTLFYENPALADQAGKLADALRAQNPGVSVR
jgi:tetratricopeptide (TPR) repeat protein